MTVVLAVGQTMSAETKRVVAFSMRAAQNRLENIRTAVDFRESERNMYLLGGITKPWAVVLDKRINDIILVGDSDPSLPSLTLDDWIVALKARYSHPADDPGVSIGPEMGWDATTRESYSKASTQHVSFFAGIENTRFGQLCYEADWFLKEAALGYSNALIENVTSYFDLVAGEPSTSQRVPVRFWFRPIINKVHVLGDVALLERFRLGVSTEVLYAEINGQSVPDSRLVKDQPSLQFAEAFTDHFATATKSNEAVATLEGLTRLAGLAEGLTQVIGEADLFFWFNKYRVEQTPTRVDAPILERRTTQQNTDLTVAVRGGVKLAALVAKVMDGDGQALKALTLQARSAPDQIYWTFEIAFADGKPAGVILPEDQSLYQLGGITGAWRVAFDHAGFKHLIDSALPPESAHTKATGSKPLEVIPSLNSQASDVRNYVNAKLNIGFQYPQTWRILDPERLRKDYGSYVVGNDQLPNSGRLALVNADDYQESISIRSTTTDLAAPLFFNLVQNSLNRSLHEAEAENETWARRTVNGHPALEYSGRIVRLNMFLRYKGYVLLIGGRSVVIELVAQENRYSDVDKCCLQPVVRSLSFPSTP